MKNGTEESTFRNSENKPPPSSPLHCYNTFESGIAPDENSDETKPSTIDNATAEDDDDDGKFAKLGLIALATPGVKFFKSAQSSFQEYLMNDPNILMSATTYGIMLTLISMPIVPLVGGALLDRKNHGHIGNKKRMNGSNEDEDEDEGEDFEQETTNGESKDASITRYSSGNLVLSLRSITSSVRGDIGELTSNREQRSTIAAAQSYSFVGFLAVAVLGIFIYGIGLASPWIESDLAIPVGLAGATVFGIGEGCVMVAARAFVGHMFLGGDGAFAQGVLIAANNLSMMASKNLVPWLIERQKARDEPLDDRDVDQEDSASIRIGVVACFVVQLLGLLAGILYTRLRVRDRDRDRDIAASERLRQQQLQDEERRRLLLPDGPESDDDDDDDHHHHHDEQPSFGMIKQAQLDRLHRYATQDDAGGGGGGCARGSQQLRSIIRLPVTFWIVASGRAIFLVTFKVFSRYSNSFLIEKVGVDAVRAGRLSSLNELFALFSPLVGLLAYRSPGGIVGFAIGAGVLGTVSIGSLALLPVEGIQGLPGGLLSPLVGISIAHGILIPICIAMIPLAVLPRQLGMAFAVFEVLGNLLNLTDILFGWLRDLSGNYDAGMKVLCAYAILGTVLLWISRERIRSIGMGASRPRQ